MGLEITVKGVSKKTHGIIDTDENWHNMAEGLNNDQKKALIAKVDKLGRGDKLTLVIDEDGKYIQFHSIVKSEKGSRDDFGRFDDMLKEAKKKFGDKLSIITEVILHEGKSVIEGGWLFRAKVIIKDETGEVSQAFVGHGDATDKNVDSESTRKALPRMAETRAIARALRWALAETTVEEELPEAGAPQEEANAETPKEKPAKTPKEKPAKKPKEKKEEKKEKPKPAGDEDARAFMD